MTARALEAGPDSREVERIVWEWYADQPEEIFDARQSAFEACVA